MTPEQREALGPPRRIPGGLVGRPYALDPEIARLIAEAERRGAEKALRKAARMAYNGAPDYHGSRGVFYMQSLYNEGASPWLESLADEIAGGGL